MNNEFIRASLGKRFKQDLWPGAHEVNVKKHFCQRAYGPDHFGTKRYVVNKMAVHDVEVQPVTPGTFGAFDFLAKAGVIGSKQRRCNYHWLNLNERCG